MESPVSLAIVTGAKGALGRAYLEGLRTMPNMKRMGIVRSEPTASELVEGVEYKSGIDLTNQKLAAEAIASLSLDTVKKIFLIHPVGKFKFDASPRDIKNDKDIDPEILASNVHSLTNIALPLIEKKPKETQLVIGCFGSVSDKYNVPFWNEYTASKNRLREFLLSIGPALHSNGTIRSVFINVSTTNTGNENALRPHADSAYWLNPSAIVDQSLPHLLAHTAMQYQEMDIINPKPGFNPEDYYRNVEALKGKWLKEMNGNS